MFVKVFIERHPVGSSRNDSVLYMIFAYLSFFRLEELAIEDYRKLVMSQDAVKMYTFLSFVFDAEGLKTHMRELWMEYFDYLYLDDKIIGGIEKNLPMVADILRTLEKKATGKVTSNLGTSVRGSEKDSETLSHGFSN